MAVCSSKFDLDQRNKDHDKANERYISLQALIFYLYRLLNKSDIIFSFMASRFICTLEQTEKNSAAV